MTVVEGRTRVVLDQTAFYPTSGGQPHDVGTLDDGRVVDVLDDGDVIHHVLEGPPPAVGQQIRGRIDARRRTDHTQQHSGQHVLSQAFERTRSLQTVSFHLGAEACTIDLAAPNLTPDDVRAVEHLANQIVLEDRPVEIHFVSAEDATRFGLRKPTERKGEIRIVEVLDFDRSACGGTHVARTGQIGPIKVRRWERRGATTRAEFVCGWRALDDHARRLESTRMIAGRLSVADHEIGDAVFRALDELDRARDELARLRDAALDLEAERLGAAAATLPGTPTVRLVRQMFVDRSADDLKKLALRLVAGPPTVAVLGSRGARSQLLFARSEGLPYDVGRILRDVAPLAGARGGGAASLAQGGGPASDSLDAALDAAVWRLNN